MINKKAFTLIELLVVVAIIGILAAVGVTTFGGFQEKAKVSATKAILKDTIKYTQAELIKCSLGDSQIMKGYLSCSNIYSQNGVFNTMLALTNVRALRKNGIDYGVLQHTNPYDNSLPALRSRTNYVPGQISISQKDMKLQLRTCFKTGCKSEDIQEDIIDFTQL